MLPFVFLQVKLSFFVNITVIYINANITTYILYKSVVQTTIVQRYHGYNTCTYCSETCYFNSNFNICMVWVNNNNS